MTQKIRDKCKYIEENGSYKDSEKNDCYDPYDIDWLCTTIEKLCDVVDTYESLEVCDSLMEWEDEI